MAPPHFCYPKIRQVYYIQNKEAMSLIERQADHIYKAIEKEDMINTQTMM